MDATDPQPKPYPDFPPRPQFSLRLLLLAPVWLAVAFAVYHYLGAWGLLPWLFLWIVLVPMMCRRVTITEGVMVLVLLGILAALLLPSGQYATTSGRRLECANHLKQIGLAIHGYNDVYGCFPPAYGADENGRTMTNFVAVVGPKTCWPGDKCVKLDDITDGMSNTFLVVEVRGRGIHWMEPRDLDATQMPRQLNPKTGRGISSGHRGGGANFALADGSVRFLPDTTSPTELDARLTIAGGEPTTSDGGK